MPAEEGQWIAGVGTRSHTDVVVAAGPGGGELVQPEVPPNDMLSPNQRRPP